MVWNEVIFKKGYGHCKPSSSMVWSVGENKLESKESEIMFISLDIIHDRSKI